MLLRIETKRIEPDITVLAFSGWITMTTERQRMEQMVEELVGQDNKKLILDLSAVEYIDSTGMGTIASCFTKVMRANGALRVAGSQDRVRQLFQITHLDRIIPCYPTVSVAVQSPW